MAGEVGDKGGDEVGDAHHPNHVWRRGREGGREGEGRG